MLRRLDWVAKTWGRTDKTLASFKRTPTEQFTQQMAFTPFVFEEVGSFIDQSNPDLYLFSSDYPPMEGGRDPIKRFESTLGERASSVREKFYAENFLRIFPDARAN
jgi:predicted TIM-barrel fold metal-dependent hydrolase